MPVRHFHLDVLVKSKIQHVENKHLPQQICSSSYVPSASFQEPELKKPVFETTTPKFADSTAEIPLSVILCFDFYSQRPRPGPQHPSPGMLQQFTSLG